MKTITLRNLPPELARLLGRKAQEQRMSLNRAAIHLMEEAVGRRQGRPRAPQYHDLDRFSGAWSKQEASAFEKALATQRAIDPDLWA